MWRPGVVLCAVMAAGCANAPPPYGEAIVIVDTNLAVPQLAARLRVDLYDQSGKWTSSRDFARPTTQDWPVSFSVYAGETTDDVTAYVRLRAYPEGRTRQYLLERYQARGTYREPAVPKSVSDLCAAPTVLGPGSTVTVRRGRDPFITHLHGSSTCDAVHLTSGVVAVRLDVPVTDTYTFGALSTSPVNGDPALYGSPYVQTTIQLRRACADDTSELVCDLGVASLSSLAFKLPVDTLTLTAGSYFLLAAGSYYDFEQADIVLGFARSADWPKLMAAPTNLDAPNDPVAYRLDLQPGPNPATEPEPETAIDRLIKIRMSYGQVGAARIVLDGACVGTMSKLGDEHIDLSSAVTCINDPHSLSPVQEEALDPDTSLPSGSQSGTFAKDDGCPSSDPTAAAICVPGGAFSMGGEGIYTAPARTVAVSTFYLDKYEVSIGRFRDSLSRGLSLNASDMPSGSPSTGDYWSPRSGSHEHWPVTLLTWYGARAFCKFSGGDLPTEAQWHYAAQAAGKARPTLYPWGDDDPVCDCTGQPAPCHRAVFQRNSNLEPDLSPGCLAAMSKIGGDAVDQIGGPTGDETPLGIVGLAGNAGEWVLDTFETYDGACWRGAYVFDPKCDEYNGPRRVTAGGSWLDNYSNLRATARIPRPPRMIAAALGFRCAYTRAPGT